MHSSSFVLSFTILAGLFLPALAAPQLFSLVGQLLGLIPVISTPPPAALWTKHQSPSCANVNQGTLLCCESTFNGDIPLIVYAAPTIAYKLNPNSINCIYGMALCLLDNLIMSIFVLISYTTGKRMDNSSSTCSPGTALCCQIDALVDVGDPKNRLNTCNNSTTDSRH